MKITRAPTLASPRPRPPCSTPAPDAPCSSASPATTADNRRLSTLTQLLNSLKQNGDPLVHCETKAYNAAAFHLALRIKRDPDYESKKVLADVEAALRAAFSFDARDFGQIVARSRSSPWRRR